MSTTAAPTAADVAERADALLAQLSLDQKLGQMIQAERASTTPDDVYEHSLGSVLSGGGSVPGSNTVEDWVAMHDAYWRASMRTDGGRVPIPVLYAVDAVHGHANVCGATVFPHNIGLGAARDPALIERLAALCAAEVAATGLDWTFAPTLAVARDIRWGRTYESFSEAPEIVTSYAGAYVRGLQGTMGDAHVMACAKHWVGDGGTTGGVDQGDTACSEEELLRVHGAAYPEALDAGVLTVMASFNSWNKEKCHGSRHLLTTVLKGRMGFDGFVVSDWDGVDQLEDSLDGALARAIIGGVDMVMVSLDWRRMLATLKTIVARGDVPMARIDDAVRRILSVKLRAGVFERPAPAARPLAGSSRFGGAAHRAIAREAVRKSLVLLQHRGGLPLRKDQRVLVAGKLTNDRGALCGGFTVEWQGTRDNGAVPGGSSVWEGLQQALPQVELSPDGSAADAARHDVAVVVIGEYPYAEGMGDIRDGGAVARGSGTQWMSNLHPYGNTLELARRHPEDLATIQRIRAAGIPVVAVLVSGRPLVIEQELEAADAVVAAFLPGSEGGVGIAEVLTGAHPFTGKLSFTWPATEASAFGERVPRFPFGHGLSL